MTSPRPQLFIGSTLEGRGVARAIQANLDDVCEGVVWDQGAFQLTLGTLEGLESIAARVDFAVLVLTRTDFVESRPAAEHTPRDNVLIELGLFVGRLGRERTFIVGDEEVFRRVPSDLAGITIATYRSDHKAGLQAGLGAACFRVRTAMLSIGNRSSSSPVKPVSSSNHAVSHSDAPLVTDFVRVLGLIPQAAAVVILPNYRNPRHADKKEKFDNYPWNNHETAYDDVYNVFRIMLSLELCCGPGNVKFLFDVDASRSNLTAPNKIAIGSSVSNDVARDALRSACFRFGTDDDAHTIICPRQVRFQGQVHPSTGDRHKYIGDYGLISVFRRHRDRLVVLAGCHAYGQIVLGDFLAECSLVSQELAPRVPESGDYQCVLRASVVGREAHYDGIKAFATRRTQTDQWEYTFAD
jgi:hypothetical protein